MPAKGSLLLRLAALCGIAAIVGIPAQGQFLEPADTNRFPRPAAIAPIKGDCIVFRNGDELPGALISASPHAPLHWKLSTGQDTAIPLQNVAGIRIAAARPSKSIAENPLVELRNGDHLRGAVVSFDEKQLVFKEPLLGQTPVDRSQIWKLYPQPTAGVRDGADDPAGWIGTEMETAVLETLPRRGNFDPQLAWLYFDGSYLPRPMRGQDSGWPSMLFLTSPVPHQDSGLFEVRGDITWSAGSIPGANLSISGNENEDGSSSVISVIFSKETMDVTVASPRGVERRQVAYDPKTENGSNRVSIRVFVNSILGTTDIILDGKLATRIGEDEDERAPGINYGVQFGAATQNRHPTIFSNLWIGPWDGELPLAETAGHASTALANGDVTASAPSALKEGKYLLETEVGPVQAPAASVSAIAFGGECAEAHSAARLRLVDGSVIHVASFECRDRALSSRSDVLGEFHLPLESVAEIIFDPLKPSAQAPALNGGATPTKPPASQ